MEVKNKFFLLMLASALFISFTSCGDDDDNPDYAKEIAGTYKGILSMDMGDNGWGPISDENFIITVTRNSNTMVTLRIENQNLPILGDISLDVECTSNVTFNNGVYGITGNTTWDVIPTQVTIPIQVNGTITSAGIAKINIAAIDVPGGLPFPGGTFNVVFDGNKE